MKLHFQLFSTCVLFLTTISAQQTKNLPTISIQGKRICSNFNVCNLNSNQKFNKFLNYEISADFMILDTLGVQLNKDSKPDYVVILSPVIQEEEQYKTPCYKLPQNNRVLVVFMSGPNGGYDIHTVSEKVILNKSESQSEPLDSIVSTKSGFGIKFFTGTIIKCDYYFYFKLVNNQFYLTSSFYDCYRTDLTGQRKKSNTYGVSKETNLSRIDIRKFMATPNIPSTNGKYQKGK